MKRRLVSPDFVTPDGRNGIPACTATAPDLFTVGCQLADGHDGPHRNNQVTWRWPQVVTVGGEIPDLQVESEHWQDGQVRLSWQEPAL